MKEEEIFDESQFLGGDEETDFKLDAEDYLEEIENGFYDSGSDVDDAFISPGRNITKKPEKALRETKIEIQQTDVNQIDKHKYDVRVSKDSFTGVMMIFNQKNFTPKMELEERKGSIVDTYRMRKAWESLGYFVYEYVDCRKYEIEEKVKTMLSKKELVSARSFAIAFMSHGGENYQIAAFDEIFNYMDLVDEIKCCEALKGKPKLVFVQGK